MKSALYAALFPALGVALGALIGLFGIVMNNLVLLKKEREQREYERTVERERWEREQAQTAFTNVLYQTSLLYYKMMVDQSDKAKQSQEMLAYYAEVQKWVGLALAHWPKSSPTYKEVLGELPNLLAGGLLTPIPLLHVRDSLLRMMTDDPALNTLHPANRKKVPTPET